MALVQEKVFIEVTMVDSGGNKAKTTWETDLADMAALNTEHTTNDSIIGVAGCATHFAACSDAQLLSVRFGVAYKENADIYGPANSEVERKAVISAKKSGTLEKAIINIPSPDRGPGIFLATQGEDRNIVDSADAALVAFLEHFETTGYLLLSDGESLDDMSAPANIKGRQIHRGSRKG